MSRPRNNAPTAAAATRGTTRRGSLLCISACVFLAGCALETAEVSTPPAAGGEESCLDRGTCLAQAFVSMDLISPATCQLTANRLRGCVVGPATFAPEPGETAVPLRTVVVREKTGNCSTQFPLQVTMEWAAAEPRVLSFLSEDRAVLRRPDGAPMEELHIMDSSPWTPHASFGVDCRVSLSIVFDEVDVDSTPQAQGIIAAIEQELAAAREHQRTFEQLLAFHAAYEFMRAVAQSFHVELTNETMMELREAALEAAPAMEGAIIGCGAALAPEEIETLFRLYLALAVLGDPADWQNPDGSTKSLEDFFGGEAGAVIAVVEGLAEQADPALAVHYQQELEAAAAEVARLESKLALAYAQLHAWLGGDDA